MVSSDPSFQTSQLLLVDAAGDPFALPAMGNLYRLVVGEAVVTALPIINTTTGGEVHLHGTPFGTSGVGSSGRESSSERRRHR